MKSTHRSARRTGAAPRHRGNARRASRGAAMVEALVAIPFFIIIFASTIFIGNTYRTKLGAHRESMKTGWDAAIKGCTGNVMGSLPGTSSINLKEASALPEAQLCSLGFGEVSGKGIGSTTASPLIGGKTVKLNTLSPIICDEKPVTGDFDGAAEFLWEMFKDPEVTDP
jgi:hypothetical protein